MKTVLISGRGKFVVALSPGFAGERVRVRGEIGMGFDVFRNVVKIHGHHNLV
ncbi:MAG: hypothetical protein AB1555_05600 [Nitrospirota bacterium]